MVTAANISADATAIKIRLYASNTVNANVTGSAIGPQSSGANASSLTRITWDGGNNGTTITAGTYKDSDAITYNLDHTVNQIITIYTTARNFKFGTNTGSTLYWANNLDESQSPTVTGYSSLSNGLVAKIISVGTTYSNTYNGTQASDSGWVWENGTALIKKTSIATVDGTAGSWYWDSTATKLYIHASDGSNVASNGKVYEIYGRDHNVDTNGKNYLVIDGIDCIRTAGSDSTLGGIKVTGTNTTVQNLSSHDHRRHALSFYVGAQNDTGTNLTLYNTFASSPISVFGTANGNTIKNSDISNLVYYGSSNSYGGIVIHGGASNTTIQNNMIYDVQSPGNSRDAITIYDIGTNNIIIRYNKFYGTMGNAINTQSLTGLEIYYNIFETSSNASTVISLNATTGSKVYGNTFYGTAAQFALTQINNSTGTLFKNNIIYAGKYISVENGSQTSSEYNYNDYYGGSGNYFNWAGTNYNTFANWKTNSSQDTNSISSNPLFTSATTSDFTLQSSSPAINAGTNVGLTSDYAGNSVPQGSAPDIGAYEYIFSTTSQSSSSESTLNASRCSDSKPGNKAPTIYAALPQTTDSIMLYFTDADGPLNKYVLEYGLNPGNYIYGAQDIGGKGTRIYLVQSLQPNTTYYFKVRAGNGCATGSWSNEFSAKTKGLISFNQLEITQSELEPQQVTEIPSNTSCQTYTVKSGDTLWSIAKNYLGNGNKYKEIIEQNKNNYLTLETPNILNTGWELKVNCGGTQTPTTETQSQTGYDVKVKVVDPNKKPVEGATVTLHSNPQTAKTNKEGIAEFKNVEQGEHKVIIAYSGYTGEQAVNLTGEVKEFDLKIEVKPNNIWFSPQMIGVILGFGLIVIILLFLLRKTRKKATN